MFQYYLQKFFFQILFAICVVFFFGVFFYAVYVEESYVAPTTFPDQSMIGTPIVDGANQSALAAQNLSEGEIAEFLTQAITESLSFHTGNYEDTKTKSARYFVPSAHQQYLAFLDGSQIYQGLSASNLEAKAFIKDEPILQNAVVQNGVFKWLMDVPVIMSFVPQGATEVNRNSNTIVNQSFILRIQVTRVSDPQDPERVAIEVWQALPARP